MGGHRLTVTSGMGIALSTAIAIAIATTPASSTSTLRIPSRAVAINEETAKPGTSGTYIYCQTLDTSVFSAEIEKAYDECAIKTSFSWTDGSKPTTAQRQELCSCTLLIQQLQTVIVPRCTMFRGGELMSFAEFFAYNFGLCTAPGTSSNESTSTSATRSPRSSIPVPTTSTKEQATDSHNPATASKMPLITGIIGALALCMAFAGFLIWVRRQKRDKKLPHDRRDLSDGLALSPIDGATAKHSGFTYVDSNTGDQPDVTFKRRKATDPSTRSSTGGYKGRDKRTPSSMWDDPMIIAVRIPHDMIFFGPLLARGGYGEVYKGTCKGETVAIKQLLPARRKDLVQIDAFLGEIKRMSQLDHERIVRFIGVAWNSLSDACAVVEYMENGDLRSVLTRWNSFEEQRPQGFDADKIKIALHIAHALTYLHSLQPVVVHRDLKSKNILLNKAYDAKLTDFGVSRERADSTMTAGVGSSLWMAPEVMMGERYDEKADVFSFGVVLSELDSHQLPYSRAREMGTNTKLPDSAILQLVSLGRLSVSFSEYADGDLVTLGHECVDINPENRPSAAQVLHRVDQVARFAW